jgi:VHL beta domain/Stigma-specific protein, Stig1
MILGFGAVGIAAAISVSTGCGGTDATATTAEDADSGSSANTPVNAPVNSSDASGPLCGGGTKQCGSSCVDTKIDSENCGSCGNKCGKGDVCSNGSCGSTCSAEQALCTGNGGAPYCADTKTDNANCGACGNACGQGLACTDGKCPALTVTGGTYTLLDSDADGGVRSISSAAGASFTLLNESDASVDLKWVDYSGAEQSYGTLAAGANLNQGTYVTHVWNVRNDADGGFLGGFVLDSPNAFTVTVH